MVCFRVLENLEADCFDPWGKNICKELLSIL